MGDFFGSLYCIFEDFFGLDLANYMWGQSATDQTSNLFIGIGFWLIGITVLIAVVFYYVINKPSFGNFWAWLVACIVNALANFAMGYYWTVSDYYAGLMVTNNPVTNMPEQLPIYQSDCLCFGVSNALLSIGLFFIVSLLIKNWSNAKNAPFSIGKII